MTVIVAVVTLLAFGTGLVEGLVRGGGVASVSGGAIAGFVAGAVVAGVLGLAWALRWLLPAGVWAPAAAVAAVVFVAGEFVVAGALALRFRDPALVALAAAVAGVAIAGVCVAVVVPLAARAMLAVERWTPSTRVRRVITATGLAVGIGGAAALVAFAARPVQPRSGLVARAIALAEAITDLDGDGDGLVLPPRDCAPLSPDIDGRRCAER